MASYPTALNLTPLELSPGLLKTVGVIHSGPELIIINHNKLPMKTKLGESVSC
jgi:hypothetical protein